MNDCLLNTTDIRALRALRDARDAGERQNISARTGLPSATLGRCWERLRMLDLIGLAPDGKYWPTPAGRAVLKSFAGQAS